MKTLEFTERAGDDRVVILKIPVDLARTPYHVIVHLQPIMGQPPAERLSEEFIEETAGKWVGDFVIENEGDYEQREPL